MSELSKYADGLAEALHEAFGDGVGFGTEVDSLLASPVLARIVADAERSAVDAYKMSHDPARLRRGGAMSLTDFLLARVAEDEAQGGCDGPDSACDRMAGRVLAECEAKRAIVTYFTDEHGVGDEMLELLALPYASHPDYREEWRP